MGRQLRELVHELAGGRDGRFQDPLRDGVDVVTFSTYKSYGGPPGGAIATRDPDVAARVFAAVYPGLTANFDAGRLRALGIAAAELLAHGAEYAARCIDAARALGEALDEAGLLVVGSDRGYTASHHLAVALPNAMTADSAVDRLERAGIYVSATSVAGESGPVAVLRLGTQELVRRGFGPTDMPAIAALIARVLGGDEPPSEVRVEVAGLRHRNAQAHARRELI